MTARIHLLSALSILLAVGCAAAPSDDAEATGASGDALTDSANEDPTSPPPNGVAPKVLQLDLRGVDYDISKLNGPVSNYADLHVDVLDTGDPDRSADNLPRSDMKWVASDKKQLPSFVTTFTKGIDVGGGKCRITTLSLKKVAVGCKWTF